MREIEDLAGYISNNPVLVVTYQIIYRVHAAWKCVCLIFTFEINNDRFKVAPYSF